MTQFKEKINFLLKNLSNGCDKELTKRFIKFSLPSATQLRARKITIKKWIKGEISMPYNFQKDYEKYIISRLIFKDGSKVFPFRAFDDWDIDVFKQRFIKYKEDKENTSISFEDYKYLYYYHEGYKELVYFKIIYQKNHLIELVTSHHAQTIIYEGEIIEDTHSSMLHFIVSNEYEMMFFSFSALDLKLDDNIYGLCLSKDFLLKNPKSALVLLSQNLLSSEKKRVFQTKINPSNITIVNNKRKSEQEGFIDNLSIHLKALKSCRENYTSNSIYLNLFLSEFNLFYQKFESFENQYEYYLSFFSRSISQMLNLLEQTEEILQLKIIYTLKDLNKSLFNHDDNDSLELYESIIRLSQEEKISFEFIIVIGENLVINNELKDRLLRLKKMGISLFFRNYEDISIYSTMILIDSYSKLAIYGLKGEKKYSITKSPKDVMKLKKDYELQKRDVRTLEKILEEKYPLNGIWYLYGNGSNDTLHIATLDIEGDNIDITLNSHDNKKYHGKVYRVYGEILLCTTLGFIKFREEEQEKLIKIVSLMSDQHNGNGKPIILFALLSKLPITEEDREILFSAFIDQENSSYSKSSFKLSLSIDEVLRPLLFKYESFIKNTE